MRPGLFPPAVKGRMIVGQAPPTVTTYTMLTTKTIRALGWAFFNSPVRGGLVFRAGKVAAGFFRLLNTPSSFGRMPPH